MRLRFLRGLLLLSCVAFLCGCRKDLCYDHDLHGLNVRVVVQSDWECVWERDHGMNWDDNWQEEFCCTYEELCPEPATGIAAFVYNEDGTRTERHLPAGGGELPMSEGRKSLLFYNDDTRYIVFSEMDSWATASATTRTRTRSTYSEMHSDERTVNAPDMLYGEWIEEHEAMLTTEPVTVFAQLQPLVYTYLVRYEFDEGLEYVTLARGALSGMAESVYLQDGRTDGNAATILYECELKEFGSEARVASFGVPDFTPGEPRRRAEHRYGLNLEVRLRNGKIKTFEFDVTDQMASQPRGGVITVTGLTVTDDEAAGDAGFDVDVDGWGDYEDIDLPLN
ncbi:MAG: DUF5119 domain-containing protein [Alistipes sp.]|nr:DUF5119 domain-containing protein [Alistipes sp.]